MGQREEEFTAVYAKGYERACAKGYTGVFAKKYAEEYAKGCIEERNELIEKMLSKGKTPEEIADLCEIDLDKIKNVQKQIKL